MQEPLKSSLSGIEKFLGLKLSAEAKNKVTCLHGYVYTDKNFLSLREGVTALLRKFLRPRILWAIIRGILSTIFRGLFSARELKIAVQLKILLCQVTLLDSIERVLQAYKTAQRDFFETFPKLLEDTAQIKDGEIVSLIDRSTQISINFLESDFGIYATKNILFAFINSMLDANDLWSRLPCSEKNPTITLQADFREFAQALKNENKAELFLEKLSQVRDARDLQGLSATLDPAWQKLLAELGHISLSWDLRAVSLKDSPTQLKSIFSALLRPEKVREQGSPVVRKLQPEKLPDDLQSLLDQLVALMQADEEQHFMSGKILTNARELVAIAKNQLFQRGILAAADDVYFLTVSELKNALSGKHQRAGFVALRRKKQWMNKPWPQVPEELGYGLKGPTKTAPADQGQKQKILMTSSGRASGPAAFAESFEDAAKIQPGAILFTSCPKPELVALYPILSGIVTQTGGLLSHGFVAARELGIPAISGFHDFQRFQAGEMLTLDANCGSIEAKGAEP